jgi:hypothetical protein
MRRVYQDLVDQDDAVDEKLDGASDVAADTLSTVNWHRCRGGRGPGLIWLTLPGYRPGPDRSASSPGGFQASRR